MTDREETRLTDRKIDEFECYLAYQGELRKKSLVPGVTLAELNLKEAIALLKSLSATITRQQEALETQATLKATVASALTNCLCPRCGKETREEENRRAALSPTEEKTKS